MRFCNRLAIGLACSALFAGSAAAQDMGKLLATGGVSQVEGAGGGGLTPWALITGYGSDQSFGGNVHATYLKLNDFKLTTYGAAVGIYDRVELSVAKQKFEGDGGALDPLVLKQDIFGLKVRVIGDAVYDQDSWLPQIAVGLQYKRSDDVGGLGGLGVRTVKDLGAKDDKGVDFYVAATKILLDQSLLLNGTARYTKANQFGLLGFGSAAENKREVRFEGSIAYLVTRKIAVGAEFRQKPDNLRASVGEEKAAYDLFAAWFPTRNVSLTAAYVNLGPIAPAFVKGNQKGPYVSLQVGF